MSKGAKSRAQRQFEKQKPEHQLGDAPIEAEYHQRMTELAGFLDELFNGQRGGPGRETGFVLMVFPFDGFDGRCNFISNGADRKDIVVLMKEMITRFEGAPQQSGKA